jgi:hypothetical protein
MPGRNERELERMVRTMERFLAAGATECAARARHRLVQATPKDTRFAAGWWLSVGGPPEFRQLARPPARRFALPRLAETRAELRRYRLGDPMSLVSPAGYIEYLNRGSSPQARADFVPREVDQATREMREWRWKGR